MRYQYWPILLAATAVASTSGCQQGATYPPDQLAPIKVGIMGALSGGLRGMGPAWMNAAALAANQVNAGGGVLPGQRVQLVAVDDKTSPETSEQEARRLVEEEEVVAIIGASGSGMTAKAVGVTEAARVPLISGTAGSNLLNGQNGDDPHPFFFRTVPVDDAQGELLANLAFGTLNETADPPLTLMCRRAVIIHLSGDYGTPLADTIEERFTNLGGYVAQKTSIDEGLPSYAENVQRAIDRVPECIFLVTYGESGGTVVNEWYDLGGEDVMWFGSDGISSEAFVAEAGPDANGVYGVAAAPDPNRAEFLTFHQHYRATFGDEPVTLAGAVYDATAILLLAVAVAGSTDGEAIQAAIIDVANRGRGERTYYPGSLIGALDEINTGDSVDYDGATGEVDLLDNGNVESDLEVWRYDGSSFEHLLAVSWESIQDEM